jgi:transaldolase
MNPLLEIRRFGQSVWLDNLSRGILHTGSLQQLIDQDGLSGVTSNPNIFLKAVMSEMAYYEEDLARIKASPLDAGQRYEALVIPEIQAACDLFLPVFDASNGDDGYVSLELSPRLAYDEARSVDSAHLLHRAINRENLLIKVPATPAGVRAFERLIADGINVNVTLMFSLSHVLQIAQAYIRGAREYIQRGGDVRTLKSVASLFLSRVDAFIDKQPELCDEKKAVSLRGYTGVAVAKLAYQRYKELFHGDAFADLAALGVRPQYLLWGSTGTKNPAYSDVFYVESLIGPETVNTMPDATLTAFRDHGKAALTLEQDVGKAETHVLVLEKLGIDLHAVGEKLQKEGVKLFDDAYTKLLKLLA